MTFFRFSRTMQIMKVLIVYGTNASGTLESAEIIAQELTAHGAEVSLASAGTIKIQELSGYDVLCFGSCTWGRRTADGTWLEGQPQDEFFAFAERLRKEKHLAGKQCAVFCLGDHRYAKFCAAAEQLTDLVHDVGGLMVGTPLTVDQYYFHLSENRLRVRNWATQLARTVVPHTVAV